MPFGKSAEEKAAEKARQQAEEATRQAEAEQRRAHQREEWLRQELLASPVGQATTAKEEDQGFLEVQLEVGTSQREVSLGTADFARRTEATTHAGTLSAIEAVGWRLEHVGYIFRITGESSREKVLGTGQSTAVSGETVGIYLFRNTSPSIRNTAEKS